MPFKSVLIKWIFGSLLVAVLAFNGIVSAANLKVKVGVVMNNGDVKFVAKRPFYLATRSYADVHSEIKQNNPYNFISFLKEKGASEQLIKWAVDNPSYEKVLMEGLMPVLSGVVIDRDQLNMILNSPEIPEFKKFKDWANNKIQCENFEFKKRNRIPCLDLDLAEGLIPEYLDSMSEKRFNFQKIYYIERTYQLADQAMVNYTKYSCQTDFNGECNFTNVVSGKFFLTPIESVKLSNSSIFWDYPINIKSESMSVELSNDNSTKK